MVDMRGRQLIGCGVLVVSGARDAGTVWSTAPLERPRLPDDGRRGLRQERHRVAVPRSNRRRVHDRDVHLVGAVAVMWLLVCGVDQRVSHTARWRCVRVRPGASPQRRCWYPPMSEN